MKIDEIVTKLEFCAREYHRYINTHIFDGIYVRDYPESGAKEIWEADTPMNKTYEDMIETLNTAKDTIRKYQKIEQILDRTIDDGTCMYDTLEEIQEVVDGTN